MPDNGRDIRLRDAIRIVEARYEIFAQRVEIHARLGDLRWKFPPDFPPNFS